MNKLIVGVLVGIALCIGYAAAGPYLTLDSIKGSIESNDTAMIGQDVDFVALRQNLKDQLNAKMLAKSAATEDDSPMGKAMATMFGPKMVDSMVDSYITPAAISRLLAGQDVKDDSKPSEINVVNSEFDSMSMFSVYIKGKNDAEARVILEREAFTWRVTNIIMPDDA